MRFQDLHIETRRERPAKARTDGEALLIRAGYLDSHGALTDLGQRSAQRLLALEDQDRQLERLGLSVLRTANGEELVISRLGNISMLHCPRCGYSDYAGTAIAAKPAGPQQPLRPLERVETPGCKTIESLAAFLGAPTSKTAKALLYSRPGTNSLVFVLLRGDRQLAEHKLRAAAGALEPATPEQIASAGAVPGYASPIGISGALVIADDLIANSTNLIAGANVEGFHLKNTNLGRDYAAHQVADLTLAAADDPCVNCGSPLQAVTGLLLADEASFHPENALLALAEDHHDERGLHLPTGAAPFDVYLLHLPSRTIDTLAEASRMHAELEAAGISVLLDDRDVRAGVKFNDADLIGCPIRVTVGEKHLRNRMVELNNRISSPGELIPVQEIAQAVRSRVALQND